MSASSTSLSEDPIINTDHPGINTVVIGGGPGGLMDALYMLLKGHNVTLFEARDEFANRANDVFLQEQLVKQLLKDFTQFYECGYEIEYVFSPDKLDIKLRYDPKKAAKFAKEAEQAGRAIPSLSQDDLDFIDILHKGQGNIRISEFQDYMQIKIADYCAEHPKQAFKILHDQVTMVDEMNSSVIYRDQNAKEFVAVGFDNLLISEGAKRNLTNQLFGENNVEKVASADINACAHAVGFIDVSDEKDLPLLKQFRANKPLSTPFLPLSINLKSKDIPVFAKYGWSHDDIPNFYLRPEIDKKRFYFACEIPAHWQQTLDEIAQTKDPKSLADAKEMINRLVSDWVKTAISKEYPGLNANKLNLVMNGPDKVQTFMKDPTRLKLAYKQTKNGANIFITADALFTSVYKLGTGHYFAGIAGKAVADCFNDQGRFTASEPFNKALETIARTYNFLLTVFKILKLVHEHPNKSKYIAKPLANRVEGMKWMYRKTFRPQVSSVDDLTEHAHIKDKTKPIRPKPV